MGILKSKQQKGTTGPTKRRSTQLDFSNLGPLKPGGTVGFSSFRDNDGSNNRNKSRKKSSGSIGAMEEDSDEDDDDAEIVGKMDDVDDKDVKTLLSPEDAKYTGELADGVGRIKASLLILSWVIDANQITAQATALCRAPECKFKEVPWVNRYHLCRRNSPGGNRYSTYSQPNTVKQRIWRKLA